MLAHLCTEVQMDVVDGFQEDWISASADGVCQSIANFMIVLFVGCCEIGKGSEKAVAITSYFMMDMRDGRIVG